MKFAIVLVALVAVVAAAPQERGILDNVQTVVQDAIAKAQADLESIFTLVQGLTSSAQGKVDAIIASAKNEISSAIASLETTLNGMIAKGGSIAVCAQQNLGELTEFKNNVGKNVEQCAGNMSDAVDGYENEVMSQIAALKSAVSELTTIIDECSVSPMQAALCAFNKVQQVEALMQNIMTQATSAIEAARAKATAVVGQIQTCAQQVVGEATITLNKFTSAVRLCA